MCVCVFIKNKNQPAYIIHRYVPILVALQSRNTFFLERYVQYHLTARCWLVCGLIHEGGLAWTSIVNSKQSIKSTHTFAWFVFPQLEMH